MQEALKSTTFCGAPRLDALLTYRVLPPGVVITVDGSRPGYPELAAEASANLADSIRDYLSNSRKLQVAPPPSVGKVDIGDQVRPNRMDAPVPCGQRLKLEGYAIDSREPGDVLVFAQARNFELPAATRLLYGGLITILVVGAVFSGQIAQGLFSGGESGNAVNTSLFGRNYLILGMADAATLEILWVRTLLLLESDSLRSRDDVLRLLGEAFKG